MRLIDIARRQAVQSAERRGEPAELIARLRRSLRLDSLTIGFARRFATYKRADLILQDIEAIAAIAGNPQTPIQLVFAGKAHPQDWPGKEILQRIARLVHDPVRRQGAVHRGLRHQRRPASGPGRRRVDEQSAAAARSVRHQRPEGRPQRRAEPVDSRRVVGRSLRRPERFRHRDGRYAHAHRAARSPRRRGALQGARDEVIRSITTAIRTGCRGAGLRG